MELEQAEIIQVRRKRARMNQGDFGARAFGTSFESGRTKIKNIELGKQAPTRDDLEKMAKILDCPVSALLPAKHTGRRPDPEDRRGIRVDQSVLALFPGLEEYIGMLNKAAEIDDRELISYISERLAALLQRSTRDSAAEG